MSMADQWQCPLCGAIMQKPEAWTMDLSPATGTVQCGHCGGSLNASDVQRGQYDVGLRAATGGGKGCLKGCLGGCCGCLVLVVVGFVALALLLPWIVGSVEGPDYSTEAKRLYGGDLSRLEGHIEELPSDQIEALVLEELRAKPIGDLFVDPAIPPDKLANARASCMVPDDEQIFGLIDATVSGTAEDAMLFGAGGIYYHNGWAGTPEGPGKLPYYRFPMTQFASHGFDVSVGENCNFDASGSDAEAGEIVDLLSRITRALLDTVPEEARDDGAPEEQGEDEEEQ
jgi:hypothetical protein